LGECLIAHYKNIAKEVFMEKTLFENFREGLTVGALKKIIAQIPDDMEVCVNLMGSYFPANTVRNGRRKAYPFGCNGIPSGEKDCIKIS
jgi:hypothetical protein